MTKWIVGLGLYAAGMAWLLWEIRHAPEAKDCLPMSRRCSWCGEYMTPLDRELANEGARTTHTICEGCAETLMEGL